jgi:hypothetical protein
VVVVVDGWWMVGGWLVVVVFLPKSTWKVADCVFFLFSSIDALVHNSKTQPRNKNNMRMPVQK